MHFKFVRQSSRQLMHKRRQDIVRPSGVGGSEHQNAWPDCLLLLHLGAFVLLPGCEQQIGDLFRNKADQEYKYSCDEHQGAHGCELMGRNKSI